MIRGKRIFLTGGAGFIGSHIVEKLIGDNEITVYDNCHRNAIKFVNLKNNNLNFITGDILDKEKLSKSILNHDIVIHLAAIAGVGTVVSHPVKTLSVNLIGTYNVLEAVKSTDLELFVDFSTSEVYGPEARDVTEEAETIIGKIGVSRWTYAVSKLAAEHLSHAYCEEHSLPAVSVRPFNIYGPRQVGEGAIHDFAVNAVNNKDLIVHGDGRQVRAWCFIDDFIKCFLLVLENKKAVGNVFNIGNPKTLITVNELAKKVIELSSSKSKIRFENVAYPDVGYRVPNIDKARSILGFEPTVGLDEGIKETIRWYKK